MNCPKCNAPINVGDKLCQTCGCLVQPTPQPTTTEGNVQPTAKVETPVMASTNNMQQPQPSTNMPMGMTKHMSSPPQAESAPQETKKNNIVVYVLLALIAALLVGVVFLIVSSNKEKEPTRTSNDTDKVVKDDEDEQTNIASNYTKITVNEYTFELPKGYTAGVGRNTVLFYDQNMTDVEGYMDKINMNFSSIDTEKTKANLSNAGITNLTYSTKKINNKNALIYSGNYNGLKVEIIYLDYSFARILAATVYYKNTSNVQKDVYDILGRIVLDDLAFSSNTDITIPNLDITPEQSLDVIPQDQ